MDTIEIIMSEYGITPLPKDTVEAMAYVPFQPFSPKMFDPVQGYEAGTIFPSLNKPFYGSKCKGDRND